MLIISDRINSKFLYLQSSPIYQDLKYKQRDIYILWNTLSDSFPYRSTLSTYDALINVLIWKCQEVDAYNSTYNTINPNYADIGGGIVIVPEPITVPPVKLYFTNNATPGVADWQTNYADTYGNDPDLTIFLYNGTTGSYNEFSGVSVTLQFDGTNNLLLNFVYDFGAPSTGYIRIAAT